MVAPRVVPLFTASLEAAEEAGDLAPRSADAANRFWFAHHVAAMMAFASLPDDSCIPYQGALDWLVEEAADFILRGHRHERSGDRRLGTPRALCKRRRTREGSV